MRGTFCYYEDSIKDYSWTLKETLLIFCGISQTLNRITATETIDTINFF